MFKKTITSFLLLTLLFSCEKDKSFLEFDTTDPKILGTVVNAAGDPIPGVGVHIIFINPYQNNLNLNRMEHKLPPALSRCSGKNNIPLNYQLLQNFPNPFNPATSILFALPQTSQGKTMLQVFDYTDGQLLRTLVEDTLQAGYYQVLWNGRTDGGAAVSNGLYRYRMVADDFSAEKVMCVQMLDPEHIRSLNSIPLTLTDDDGKFVLPYSKIPLGEIIPITDETGPEIIGHINVGNSIDLVMIKEGYRSLVKTVRIPVDRGLLFDARLEHL